MKAEVGTGAKPNTFKPITLTLTAQTIEEARLLYHICNRKKLWDAINEEGYPKLYAQEVSNEFYVDAELLSSIKELINKQGFEI